MKQKITITSIAFILIGLGGLQAQTATPPSIGDGTSGTPYEISTLDNLYWLTQNSTEWDKYYIQTVNIDAASTNVWDTSAGFTPIGNSTTPFSGSYNGQGNTIDNLFINRPLEDNIGFIGTKNGTVKNLGVTNVNITGRNTVGGLAGYAASLVDNCYSSGTVTGIVGVGGLVGGIPDTNNGSSTTSNSYSTCDVNGSQSVGGLAGSNGDVVSNSYSTGIVTGGTGGSTGGLIGRTWYGSTSACYSESVVTSTGDNTGGLVGNNGQSLIQNCYSTGTVNGVSYVGGLVGNHSLYNITNCYSIGTVNGSGSFVGGLVGDGASRGWGAHNSFWNTETSGQVTSEGGIEATTLEMNSLCTYVDGVDAAWDFMLESLNGSSDIWGMNATVNGGFPFLAWQGFAHTAPACALGIEKNENIKERDFYINNNTLYFKNTQDLSELKNIEVYNLLGQKVFETSVVETQISLSTLKNGIYFLIVKNKENQYDELKFIIY
ncbi:MAG: GLUG motif-containing protein [Urechidicola sp.]|nr:GLUG motif-containing protein [Urechidicola sp.]